MPPGSILLLFTDGIVVPTGQYRERGVDLLGPAYDGALGVANEANTRFSNATKIGRLHYPSHGNVLNTLGGQFTVEAFCVPDYGGVLLEKPGALLVTQGWDDKANVMAIGWAHIGILWSEPICMVYVRHSRHSYTLLEQLRQFTVNTVTPDMNKIVELCGTVSGRDEDKFTAADLMAAAGKKV